ncbi:atrial natriuretic peptide receptor 2-like [Gigantopelta aegis]|uniref:atrial natriuretic peptide receptor 2-like n=1 Tax=Gigantopelta aegis TaxID=1735272 RepID=UPI001B88D70A|nr:atrial natriuretic peptide receptor 2-like [Gigantopelta aegis]
MNGAFRKFDRIPYCLCTCRFDALEKEKLRINSLLRPMLPKPMADLLLQHMDVQPTWHPSATVCISDIRGIIEVSASSSPVQTFDIINKLIACFDDVIAEYDLYKIETIGDANIIVSSVSKHDNVHASEICSMALDFLEKNEQITLIDQTKARFKLRIGIHTGPVMAAVVGAKIPKYCLIGETITVVTKLASLGKAGRIQISQSTYEALADCKEFVKGEVIDEDIVEELESFASMTGRSRTFYVTRRERTTRSAAPSILSLNDDESVPVRSSTSQWNRKLTRTDTNRNDM